jgi:predicted nucleotidyltransferase
MESMLEQNLPQVKSLMRAFGVEHAYLFGSAATGTINDDSDIDFIIRFPDDMDFVTYADNYFALADALELLLHKKVDLVTEKTLTNPFLIENINLHKIQLL